MVVNFMDIEAENNIEKRIDSRVLYDIEVYYPMINNVSLREKYDNADEPLMKALNISESGICFSSSVPAEVGDFLSFMLQIGKNPSFWCFCEVKWIKNEEESFIIGCKFYLLSDEYLRIIKEYVASEIK